MKIFVTGGSGFLGKHLIKRLIQAGHEVAGLARSAQSSTVLRQLGATTVTGDLSQIQTWAAHLNQYQIVIHCAAPVEFWGPWEKFYQDITLATLNLFTHASQQGVERFIYISSESVLQDLAPLLDIDETYPYPTEPNSYYGKAKQLAEQGLLNQSSNTTCIILRPTYIWGPGDKTGQTLAEKVRSGQFMWIDQGSCPLETVHVDNLVEAICLACLQGQNQAIYMVTDDQPTTVREYFMALFRIQGVTPPTISLPSALIRPIAGFLETLWKIGHVKNPPPISRFEWSFVGLPRRYNIAKIKRELGYRPIVDRATGLQQLEQIS